MSTLYLDRKNLTLKLDGKAIALYEDNAKRGTVPLNMLERVVIRGNIFVESRVLCAMSEHLVDVLFMSGRGAQRTMAFSHSHNDSQRRLAQYHMAADASVRIQLSQQLVLAKIAKQRQLLQRAQQQRPDQRSPLFNAGSSLQDMHATLHNKDIAAISIEHLRGIEGAAAAAYFAAFKTLFAPSLQFNARKKRPPTDPVNACLSLGYTLLHFEAVGICHIVGLDPKLGFFHEAAFGRESLACDLIEPFRPRLDDLIWTLFRERQLRTEHFSNESGKCLLNKSGRKCFYAQFELFMQPLRRLLRLTAHQLARQIVSLKTQTTP